LKGTAMAQTRAKVHRRNWVMSAQEARAYFDDEARRLVGMDGEEFVRAWEAGEFDDNPDRPGVMELVIILPFYYDSLP